MTFLEPTFLLLLAFVPGVWFLPRRVQDIRHGLIRSVVLVLLVLGLARPVTLSEVGEDHLVFIIDGSASLSPAQRSRAESSFDTMLQRVPESTRVSLIRLGSTTRSRPPEKIERTETLAPSADRSSLGAAIEAAAQHIPSGARGGIVLLTDGLDTDSAWGSALTSLGERGIPLHTVPLERAAGDVYPVALQATEALRVGRSARLLVDVIGENAEVTLTLSGPGGVLAEQSGHRLEGRLRTTLEFEPETPGFLSLTLEVTVTGGSDLRGENNTLTRTFPIQDPLAVLYLGDRMQDGGERLADLVGPGFDLDQASEVSDADMPEFGDFDLVVIDDRPAARLSTAVQQKLVEAVRDRGVGLLASGGGASFGPGGYHQSPLETVLPVEFVQKEEKKDPSTALAIIIDTSGSMSGNRIRLAKEVTRLAIRRLLPHDKIGIVEFYGAKRWAAPLQSAANAIDIQRALNRLDAGGGTILLPAIEEAYYGLKNVQTRYKHVLVLTDAGVETGPYESLMRRMSRDGICVSTVLVGPERHSEFLVQVADWGNGRFYNCSDRFNLPEVMLKQPSTARLPAYRPGVHPLEPRGGPGWWGEVDPRSTPDLEGYVETRTRPGAEVLLRTARESHPILATWRYGLGRVTALTTEPTGPGTRPWRDWPGYGPLLARVMNRTSSETREPFHFELRRDDHRVELRAERRTRRAVLPVAHRMGLDGTRGAELSFRERADGIFTASFVADPAETVRVEAGATEGPGAGIRLVCERAWVAETQVDPTRALHPGAAARATGGALISVAGLTEAPTLGGGNAPASLAAIWPYCLLLALLAYLGDIAYRRSALREERFPS